MKLSRFWYWDKYISAVQQQSTALQIRASGFLRLNVSAVFRMKDWHGCFMELIDVSLCLVGGPLVHHQILGGGRDGGGPGGPGGARAGGLPGGGWWAGGGAREGGVVRGPLDGGLVRGTELDTRGRSSAGWGGGGGAGEGEWWVRGGGRLLGVDSPSLTRWKLIQRPSSPDCGLIRDTWS